MYGVFSCSYRLARCDHRACKQTIDNSIAVCNTVLSACKRDERINCSVRRASGFVNRCQVTWGFSMSVEYLIGLVRALMVYMGVWDLVVAALSLTIIIATVKIVIDRLQ